MGEIAKLFAPLVTWWQQAGSRQRLAVVGCAGLCLAVALGAAAWGSRTRYATLFSGLSEKDAGAIVAKLQEAKVPYQVAGEGAVQVPEERVRELRLQMASAGLPQGGSVGFEIFDQNRLGLSEFQEKLNYRRALQGELERTIAQLTQIEQARVHIALPERQLFAEQQEQPTASVILKLRPGARLGQSECSAITHLVASSVEGLPQGNVTVVDTNGVLLSGTGEDALGGPGVGGDPAAVTQLRFRKQVERQIEGDLQSLLDRALGAGKAVVRVSADLDFSQRQTQEETYQPESDGHGVLESEHENRETYQGAGRLGGVPGLRSNQGAPMAAAVPGGGGNYERVETQNQYRVSKRVETTTNTPGQVKRLSLAIFIDEKVPMEEVYKLQDALGAAAGLDTERGDRIVVQRLPFGNGERPEPPVTLVARLTGWLAGSGKELLAIALLGCFAFLARGLVRARSVIAGPGPAALPAGGQPQLSLSSDEAALPGPEQAAAQLGEGEAPFAVIDADRAAQVVRAWLMEEVE